MENNYNAIKNSVRDHHEAEKVSIQSTGLDCWNAWVLLNRNFIQGLVKTVYYKNFNLV